MSIKVVVFGSKRKMFPSRRSELSRHSGSSQKSRGAGEMQYLKEVFKKVGISLQFSNNPSVYSKESVFIMRDMQRELEQHENYPNNIPEFMNGLKHFFSGSNKGKYFKNALMPSMSNDSAEISTASKQQDCLFRVLLEVDCIQTEVITLLLEEAVKHVVEETEDTMWLRLILGPLRYLSYIREPSALSDKLLQLLEVGVRSAQLELLAYFPEIIPDSEYEDSARRLAQVLDENPTLTAAIVDCLSCLGLGADLKEEIQDRLLAIMNLATSLDTFPMILDFLVADCRAANLSNILIRTRSAIDSVTSTCEQGEENDTNQVLTFQKLRKLTCESTRQVAEGWFNVISALRSPDDHRPIDVLILLMLHSSDCERRRVVETLIRRKIKAKQLRPELVAKTLDKYLVPQIFNDCLTSIVGIAKGLLTGQEPLYVEMASVLFVGAFSHKHADGPSRQQILDELVLCPGGRAAASLGVLLTIAANGAHLLRPHSLQLMSLLDTLNTVGLTGTGQIFELLSAILWAPIEGNDTPDVLQNDMNMIVRKLLTSGEKTVRYRGVLAAVAVAKHMARTHRSSDSDSTPLDTSYSSVSDIPAGPARQAAMLLEMASENAAGCLQVRGLYYDQLAHMVVNSEELDHRLVAWLTDTITTDFQSFYVVNGATESANDMSFTVQYTLNAKDAVNNTIIINLGELSVNIGEGETSMISTLAPLFRLVRVLHQRQYEGSLQSIDALLGCGISLPDLDPDVGIDSFGIEDSRKIMDCTFHCINWFRELVSAFVTQKGQIVRRKVITRIQNLVELEETMKEYTKQLPDHRLPVSHFYNVNLNTTSSSAQHEPLKTKRKKSNSNISKVNTQGANSETQPLKSTRKPTKEKEVPSLNYREMDTDIILLLKHPLAFTEESSTDEEVLSLNLSQFKFILRDLVHKLQTLCKNPNVSNLSHLCQTVKPEDLVRDCVQLMPFIDGHLTHVVDELKKLVERCDGIQDAHEMFQPQANDLKTALGLLLEVIALVLSWREFQSPTKLPLLRECLRALIIADDKNKEMRSAAKLAMTLIGRLLQISEFCLTLHGAVSLVNIVKALDTVSLDRTAVKQKLILLSGKLLERKWYTVEGLPEAGATASLRINELVRAHLNGSDITSISSIVSWIHAEAPLLKSKDQHLTTFQCITKTNFAILYRGVNSALLEALKTELNEGKTNSEHLDIWRNVATTLHGIMDIGKMQENRSNLNAFLKNTTGILKLFLSQALPIFEITLRSKSDRVFEILKTMQQTTRFVHNLCCHSKVMKDGGLVALVPQMRLTLETLVYRVKALLAANNCSAAFWMGNLKNKDLTGAEICSQSVIMSVETTEELPPDESEPSGSEANDNDNDMDDSVSEIF